MTINFSNHLLNLIWNWDPLARKFVELLMTMRCGFLSTENKNHPSRKDFILHNPPMLIAPIECNPWHGLIWVIFPVHLSTHNEHSVELMLFNLRNWGKLYLCYYSLCRFYTWEKRLIPIGWSWSDHPWSTEAAPCWPLPVSIRSWLYTS